MNNYNRILVSEYAANNSKMRSIYRFNKMVPIEREIAIKSHPYYKSEYNMHHIIYNTVTMQYEYSLTNEEKNAYEGYLRYLYYCRKNRGIDTHL